MVSPVASQSAAFGTVEAQCCLYPQGGFKQFCSSVGWFLAVQTEMMKGLGGIISFPLCNHDVLVHYLSFGQVYSFDI